MSPPATKPSDSNSSPKTASSHNSKTKIRKRVRKACDRCRIKKTKCDGSSPCLRCRTDDVICCAKVSHRLRHRNFPQGYTEMLQRQQGQLVSCIQQLYQRLRTAGLWEHSLPANSNGRPFTHDILAALDLLEPKDDGSGQLETFNEVVASSQSDDHTSPPFFSDDTEVIDRHDSMMEQSKSPSRLSDDIRSLSPADRKSESPASQSMQSPNQTRITEAPMPSSQACDGYHASQAQLFANLAATSIDSIHHSVYPTSTVPVHHGATRPLLSFDARAPQPGHLLIQALDPSPMQFLSSHEWASSGIMLDNSDFSTDFYQLSPLEASRHSSHVLG